MEMKTNYNHIRFDFVESYQNANRRFNKIGFNEYIRIGMESFRTMHQQMIEDNSLMNEKTNKKREKKLQLEKVESY